MKNIVYLLLLVSSFSLAGELGQYTSDSNGFDTHTYFYDDGKEVVLIDTQFTPTLTKQFVQYVKSKTNSPITKVIVTHPNPDKFNGLSYLHKLGIESISSTEVAKDMIAVNQYKRDFWINQMQMFTAQTYPEFQQVQWQFSGKEGTINLKSGETLSLFRLENPAIASSQIVVRVNATGDLIVGDLIHYKAHAWLEGPLVNGKPTPMLHSWSKALDELYGFSNKDALVYGGRGEVGHLDTVVNAQKNYLNKVDTLVDGYVSNSIMQHHAQNKDELITLITKTLPDYALPYMISYSIEPLLKQKNAKYASGSLNIQQPPSY